MYSFLIFQSFSNNHPYTIFNICFFHLCSFFLLEMFDSRNTKKQNRKRNKRKKKIMNFNFFKFFFNFLGNFLNGTHYYRKLIFNFLYNNGV